jgi:hypothetical protein
VKSGLSLKYVAIFLVLTLFGLISISCRGASSNPPYQVNTELINFKDFFISAESINLGTSVRGTIFVKGDIKNPKERIIQIAAWVEVDPNDWGGVGFYIDHPWKVTSVSTDFPQGNTKPEQQFRIFTSGDPSAPLYLTIGNSKDSPSNGRGGKGSVIMELGPISSEQNLPENLEMTVGVGSKGENIQNPVSETIMVPLNVDYRTPTPTANTPASGGD